MTSLKLYFQLDMRVQATWPHGETQSGIPSTCWVMTPIGEVTTTGMTTGACCETKKHWQAVRPCMIYSISKAR